jgi:hypothetical protein
MTVNIEFDGGTAVGDIGAAIEQRLAFLVQFGAPGL